jgi:addiction module HigA family antidote
MIERTTSSAWAIHPGEILSKEFMEPLKLSGYALAKAINVPPQAVNDIVLEKRGISPEMALRLAKFLGTSEQFWMNLQSTFALAQSRKENAKELKKIKPRSAVA